MSKLLKNSSVVTKLVYRLREARKSRRMLYRVGLFAAVLLLVYYVSFSPRLRHGGLYLAAVDKQQQQQQQQQQANVELKILDLSPFLNNGSSTFEKETLVLGHVTTEYTTVVSAFFNFSANSSRDAQMTAWVTTMLETVVAPMVIFCDVESIEFMQEVRTNQVVSQSIFFVYDSVWDLMRELEVKRNASYRAAYESQAAGTGTSKRAADLYAMRNLKAHMMRRVAEMNPYNSRFFIYSDAGAWKDPNIERWPDNTFVKALTNQRLGDSLLLGQLKPHDKHWSCYDKMIAGTFLAGNAQAVAALDNAYYQIHDRMILNSSKRDKKNENFIGMCWVGGEITKRIRSVYALKELFAVVLCLLGDEQCLLSKVAFGESNDIVSRPMNTTRIRIWSVNHTDERCGNPWFFYQRFFAPASFYQCPYERMSLLADNYTPY